MLRRWLEEAGASPDDVAAVTMAANEAWENAIEHAHAFAPVPISVAFERRGDEVFITTHDVGGTAPGESDPDRGRGLALMQALMDEASFSFGGRYGGSVVLRRHLGAPRADAGGADGGRARRAADAALVRRATARAVRRVRVAAVLGAEVQRVRRRPPASRAFARSTVMPHTGSVAPRRAVSANSAANTASAITFRTSL